MGGPVDRVRYNTLVEAVRAADEAVVVTMSSAEFVALRELASFADWSAEVPNRDRGEAVVVSRLLRCFDPLISSLGTDAYGAEVEEAWATLRA